VSERATNISDISGWPSDLFPEAPGVISPGGNSTTAVLAKPVAVSAKPAAAGRAGHGARHGFRLDIQGMRAIAVAMVVIYHLRPSLLPGGFAGVDVFFVISGYLITSHLWRVYQTTGSVSLLDFWGRRARRLVPVAALVLLVSWLAARAVAPATELADIGAQIRASALYFQNWQLASDAVNYLKSDGPATPVQHFWSLSVEEQFYLVWPLLFFIAMAVGTVVAGSRKARHNRHAAAGRRAGLAVVAVLTIAVVACSLAYSVYDTKSNPAEAYFVTTTRMWELGIGGLLAMAPERFTRVVGRQGWLGWAGLAVIIASAFTLSGRSPFPGWLALVPVVGAAAMIACGGEAGRFGPAPLTSARPIVFLGGISYSLYLWHWPIINLYGDWRGKEPGWLTGPAIVIVSVLLAWLTKTFVEDKVRLSPLLAGHRWRSLSVALAAAVPVALVSTYLAADSVPWNGQLPASGYPGAAALASTTHVRVPVNPILPPIADASADIPLYWLDNCLDATYATAEKVCVFGDLKKPALTVAMVGDSIAGNWFPALDQIALQRHWKLVTDLHGTCEWTASMLIDYTTSSPDIACHQWGLAVLHDLITSIRPTVVITSGLPEDGTVAHPTPWTPAAFADIGAGMAKYWDDLEDHGISVVAIRETPLINFPEPDCLAKYTRTAANCMVPTARAVAADPPTFRAARDTDGEVKVIDMDRFICGPDECKPVVGNVLVYLDGRHLTAAYAKSMTKYLEPRLLHDIPLLAR
jgi:peptidoglycan/LPS O-acetylase OafA/YrhL